MNNAGQNKALKHELLKGGQLLSMIAVLIFLVFAVGILLLTLEYPLEKLELLLLLCTAIVAIVALFAITLQKIRANAVSRSLLQRYEAVVKSANDAIFLVNHQQSIVEANDIACDIYGYAAGEFSSLKIADLRTREEAKRIRSDLEGVNGKYPKLIETVHRRKDGTTFPVEVSIRHLRLDKEEYYFGIVRDVTERKRVEEELRQNRGLLSAIVEGTLDCVFVKDLSGRYLLANKALVQILGKDEEQILGKNDFDLFSYDSATRIINDDRETLLKGKIQTFEEELEMADGKHSYLTIKGPLTDSAGSVIGLFAIARDITARKEAEQHLRKLQRAVDQSPVSIVITDSEGNIEYVNRCFTELSQYLPQEVLGKNPRFLQSGLTPRVTYMEMWGTITAGNDWRGEFCNRKKNGDLFWENCYISPVRNSDGTITNFIAVKEDITEKRNLEAQLFHAQRLESIGTLAGGIAHDLNNVLAPILTSIELLKTNPRNEEAHSLLEIMETAALRGKEVIRQVLSFARPDQTMVQEVRPNHLLKELETLIRQTFPRSIEQSLRMNPDVWPVRVDPTQLHQVLMNLCVNARDAINGSGGKLIIGADNVIFDEHLASRHLGAKKGKYVRFWVADTGSGISPEIKDRIFDPFFTTKDVGKGTGLGLSTSYAIVHNHNGFIDLETAVGKGSTFSIFLPATDPSSTGKITPERKHAASNGEGILIVDDEPAVRNVTRSILEAFEYRVFSADGGKQALEIYRAHQPEIDLIVTDWMMPKMDGGELIRRLRRINPSVKVIVSTGLMDMNLDREISDAIASVLMKPYKSDLFLETIRNALESGTRSQKRQN